MSGFSSNKTASFPNSTNTERGGKEPALESCSERGPFHFRKQPHLAGWRSNKFFNCQVRQSTEPGCQFFRRGFIFLLLAQFKSCVFPVILCKKTYLPSFLGSWGGSGSVQLAFTTERQLWWNCDCCGKFKKECIKSSALKEVTGNRGGKLLQPKIMLIWIRSAGTLDSPPFFYIFIYWFEKERKGEGEEGRGMRDGET